jgi:hypothetical protein
MTDEVYREISNKLSVLIALSLRSVLSSKDTGSKGTDLKKVGEQVRFLASFGLDAKDIAAIVGSSVPSVRTMLTPSQKR